MSKLKIRFTQYENVVMAEILYQDESLRGRGKLATYNSFSVYSDEYPSFLDKKTLCIRGDDETKDSFVAAYAFDDANEAKKAIKNFTTIVKEINKQDEPLNPPDFSITIAQ